MATATPIPKAGLAPDAEPVDVSELYSDDGVDLSLIHWMLGLTPSERLRVAQDFVDSFGSQISDRDT